MTDSGSTDAFSTVTTRPDCEPITIQRLSPRSQLTCFFRSARIVSRLALPEAGKVAELSVLSPATAVGGQFSRLPTSRHMF